MLAHVRGLLAAVIDDDHVPPEAALDAIAAFNELDVDGALPGVHRPEVPPEPSAALSLARDLCFDRLRTLPAGRCLAVGRALRHIDQAPSRLSTTDVRGAHAARGPLRRPRADPGTTAADRPRRTGRAARRRPDRARGVPAAADRHPTRPPGRLLARRDSSAPRARPGSPCCCCARHGARRVGGPARPHHAVVVPASGAIAGGRCAVDVEGARGRSRARPLRPRTRRPAPASRHPMALPRRRRRARRGLRRPRHLPHRHMGQRARSPRKLGESRQPPWRPPHARCRHGPGTAMRRLAGGCAAVDRHRQQPRTVAAGDRPARAAPAKRDLRTRSRAHVRPVIHDHPRQSQPCGGRRPRRRPARPHGRRARPAWPRPPGRCARTPTC